MAKIVTAKEMKSYDEYTISVLGVPSMVLMERAALASVEELFSCKNLSSEEPASKQPDFDLNKVLCVCGSGNNGGDGFAIARLLFLKDVHVEVLFIGNKEKCSSETGQQYAICENYKIPILENDTSVLAPGKYTTIVDAIFGIGLIRNTEGIYKETISRINEMTNNGSTKVLSVDIPSGLSADTGKAMGTAIQANKTVTFAYNKIGLTVGDGPTYSGKITIKDIGIIAPDNLLTKYR